MTSKRILLSRKLVTFGATVALVGVLGTSGSAMAMGKKKPKPRPSPVPTSQPEPAPSQPEPAPINAPNPVPVPSSPQSERDARQIMELVRYLMVSEAKVLEAGGYAPELLAQLIGEMQSCGLSFSGPLCLDGSFGAQGLFDAASFIETRDSFIFVSLISTKYQKADLALAIETEKDPAQVVMRSINILATKKNLINPEVVKNDYLLGRTRKLIEVSTPENALEFAASEIQGSPDHRKLFHFAQYIVNVDKENKYRASTLDALKSQFHKITQSGSAAYQVALLNLLRSSFSDERDFLIAVSEELINSQDRNVSELSAITLAERNITSELVKSKVTSALENSGWAMRRLAVYALDLIKETGQDKNFLIAMLVDSDRDVRAAASTVVNRMSLDNDNLPVLGQMVSNSSWSVRRDGIYLAGRVNTPEATALILKGLVDDDKDVRAAAVAEVDKRQLGERELPVLNQLANSSIASGRALVAQYLGGIKSPGAVAILIRLSRDSDWSVRRDAVNGLGKNPVSDATIAIIARLTDSDNDVRNAAVAHVNQRSLGNAELPALTALLGSSDWEVRRKGVNYIATIQTGEATVALIPMLVDSDRDVRVAVVTQLDKRVFTNAELQHLSKLTKHSDEAGRRNVVKFVAKVNTADSTAVLVRMINDSAWNVRFDVVKALGAVTSDLSTSAIITRIVDSDRDVRNAAIGVLNVRSFSEGHVSELGPYLSNSSWEARRLAARYLGTTSSCKAVKFLQDKVISESDSDVAAEIRKSIQAIQERNGSCQ